jgi:hypothetical protein
MKPRLNSSWENEGLKTQWKYAVLVRGLGDEMKKEIVNSGKYGLVICPSCYSSGYIYNPNHQPCTRCGASGFIRMEAERDTNTPPPRNDELTNIAKFRSWVFRSTPGPLWVSVLHYVSVLCTALSVRKNPVDIPH